MDKNLLAFVLQHFYVSKNWQHFLDWYLLMLIILNMLKTLLETGSHLKLFPESFQVCLNLTYQPHIHLLPYPHWATW